MAVVKFIWARDWYHSVTATSAWKIGAGAARDYLLASVSVVTKKARPVATALSIFLFPRSQFQRELVETLSRGYTKRTRSTTQIHPLLQLSCQMNRYIRKMDTGWKRRTMWATIIRCRDSGNGDP